MVTAAKEGTFVPWLNKYQAKKTHVEVKVRLHDLLTLALDKLERLDANSGCFTTEERVPYTLT